MFCWTETDSGWETRSATGMTERREWMKKVYETISPEALYERTGIQKQIFNTIYQLMAVKEERPEELAGAGVPADDSGLLSLSADRSEETGIYQCDDHPAGQSGDENVGL